MNISTMFDENMCRLCLKSSAVTIKIFTANIPDIIETLTSIKVKENDGFPSISCKSCISDLYAAHETRNRIIESERLLKSKMVSLSTQKKTIASHSKNNNKQSQEKTDSATQSSEHEPKIEIDELFIKQEQSEDENEDSREQEEEEEEEEDEEEANAINDLIFNVLDDDDPIYDLIETETNQEKSDSHVDNQQKSSNDNTEMTNKEKDVMQPGGTSTYSNLVSSEDYEVLMTDSDIIKRDISCYPPKYSCKICNISLHPGATVLYHRNKHLKAKCKICDVIVRKDNIRKHVLSHKVGPQICYICGSQHKSIEGFRTHMFYYHKKRKFYKCEHCDAEFQLNSTLWDHRRRVHTGDRRYQCEQCGKAFFASETLKKHIDLVHLRLRLHPCDFCSKRFSSRNALKTHRRQHTGELPYACDICTAGFRQAVSLRTHMKSKHNIIVKANKPGYTYSQQAKGMTRMPSEN